MLRALSFVVDFLTLQAGPSDILHASFAGTLPGHADVENALFYNLDAKDVFSSMLAGVSFEITAGPSLGVVYEYETGPARKRFCHWRTERRLAALVTDLDRSTARRLRLGNRRAKVRGVSKVRDVRDGA